MMIIPGYDSPMADMLDRLTLSKIGMRNVNSLVFPYIDNVYTIESLIKDFAYHYKDQIVRLSNIYTTKYQILTDYLQNRSTTEKTDKNGTLNMGESLNTETTSKGNDKIINADTGTMSDNLYGFNSPSAIGKNKTGTQTTGEQTNTVDNNVKFDSQSKKDTTQEEQTDRKEDELISGYKQNPAFLIEKNFDLWSKANFYDVLVGYAKDYFTLHIY